MKTENGKLKKYKLGEIADYIGSGMTPLRSNELYWKSNDIPWLKTEQLGEYKIFDTKEYISNLALKECNLKVYPKNTLSIAMYGEGKTRGNVSILAKEMTTNQACCNLIVNKTIADYKFVFYYLKNSYNGLRSLSSGIRKNLNSEDIKNFEIFLPPLPTQQKIAAVLSALDDKIALNRRINAKLEQMAKRLYDYWFVQFDFPSCFADAQHDSKPYKASGGKMVRNEALKREIPVGWEVKRLGDIIIEIPKSKIQVNQVKNEGDIPFFTSGENILKTDKPLTNGTKIFLSTGGNAVIKLYVGDAAYSTDTYCIEFDEYTFYIYLLLKSMIDYINTNLFTGSGLKHLQKEQFKSLYCVLPPKQLLKSFNRLVSTSYTHISRNTLQQEKLTALRDRLLPLLMNGQVEVE